ncbi:hypothetical protein WBG78_11305 [Chryseolinea sp. T2]|uniref:hypothetical protein n=1 Tax=Chryseolinea sp. T2 TaxID=3129255 RepID=UPI0030781A64
MTKSAIAWTTGHALNIYANQSTPLTIHSVKEELRELQVSAKAEIDSTFFEGTYFNSVSQLQYGDRLKVVFEVRNLHQRDFVLIKGLLEFHRLPEFVFAYNKEERTFDATISKVNQAELIRFLGKVTTWINQEFSFRTHLKGMISFEREYREKLAKVYTGGDGYTLSRPF